METPEPWVYGPLELIKHADEHQLAKGDFDKRIALIGYDNAIEVSIRTFLQLHPTQRRGLEYPKDHVNTWLTNYHSLLDFFFDEFLTNLGQTPQIAKNTYIHYHDLRNNLYHKGKKIRTCRTRHSRRSCSRPIHLLSALRCERRGTFTRDSHTSHPEHQEK